MRTATQPLATKQSMDANHVVGHSLPPCGLLQGCQCITLRDSHITLSPGLPPRLPCASPLSPSAPSLSLPSVAVQFCCRLLRRPLIQRHELRHQQPALQSAAPGGPGRVGEVGSAHARHRRVPAALSHPAVASSWAFGMQGSRVL